MNKTFPASETKLAELKAKGIFPRSILLQRSIRFLVFVVFTFSYFLNQLPKKELQTFFQNPELPISIKLFVTLFAKYILISVFLLSLPMLIGMLQTKFYFSLDLAKPDFSRFTYRNPFSLFSINLIYLLVLLLLATFYFSSVFEIPFLPYKNSSDYLDLISNSLLELKSANSKIAYRLTAMLLVCGLASLLTNWWYFRKEHMMSRAELEAEQRDQQTSSQNKQAIRDRSIVE